MPRTVSVAAEKDAPKRVPKIITKPKKKVKNVTVEP